MFCVIVGPRSRRIDELVPKSFEAGLKKVAKGLKIREFWDHSIGETYSRAAKRYNRFSHKLFGASEQHMTLILGASAFNFINQFVTGWRIRANPRSALQQRRYCISTCES